MSIKHFRSPDYNYVFDTMNGNFARWGKTQDDDPVVSPYGPEILDLEVSEICHGPTDDTGKHKVCGFCYKSNNPSGQNMSFETFKHIFHLMPKTLYSIAFGIGDIDSCPDFVKMLEYCRNNDYNPNVVPNLTVNGSRLTDEWVQTLAKYIGGIAVSLYDSKELCYNAVEKLSKAGIVQVNIHKVFHSQNFDDCMQVIDDAATDPRLKEHLKAVMFLTLKPKGKRNKLMPCKDVASYKKLIKHAMSKGVQIGFDSCSAPSFLMSLKDDPDFEKYAGMVESCESNRMSGYVNVEGKWFHCSFTEGEPGWSGIDLMKVTDFMKEVWNSNEVERFRNKLLKQDNSKICGDCYLCPIYSLYDPVIGDASGKIINLEVV